MGFYDTYQAQVQPRAGQPYDVKDILMSSQAITGGLDKLLANDASDRKAQQQFEANQYVDKLLGNTTSDNYEAQSAQARGFLPYASPEMAQQWQQFGADIKGQRDYAHQKQLEAMQAEQLSNDINKTENERVYQAGVTQHNIDALNELTAYHNAQNLLDKQRLGLESQRIGLEKARIGQEKKLSPMEKLLGNYVDEALKSGKSYEDIYNNVTGLLHPTKDSVQYMYDKNGKKNGTIINGVRYDRNGNVIQDLPTPNVFFNPASLVPNPLLPSN